MMYVLEQMCTNVVLSFLFPIQDIFATSFKVVRSGDTCAGSSITDYYWMPPERIGDYPCTTLHYPPLASRSKTRI
jgi:hypothetical protein